ncbi:NAD-dependent epimerase/dehydratase family protein [uncultured Sphaerochaeta sp.]|uniref:NAD-dependent epimerase/dehydratase family protein n=1 Tax=uncultured Sphaerochaeta sp. TaxID=886478 RepID=UPI002AA8669B|nr:NAD-dependent epimerase/dehydratase family protein [uncultured Sphaerochaeta sp.]
MYSTKLDTIFQQLVDAIPNLEQLFGASFLITGASGLIGGSVVDFLLYLNKEFQAHCNIIAMSRSIEKLERRFAQHLGDEKLSIVAHDVETPFPSLPSPDYIIHAAAQAYPKLFTNDPAGTITGAVLGTLNVLDFARIAKGVRILYVSSGEVYGELNSNKQGIRETESGNIDINNVRSCYPNGKRVAENLCRAYGVQYGQDIVIARPSHVYGPFADIQDNRASSEFFRLATQGHPIVLKSEAKQLRSYTYIYDCVTGILSMLTKGVSGEAYNIANPDATITISDFAELLASLTHRELIREYLQSSAEFSPISNAVLNSEKLITLGWAPLFTVQKGLSHALDVYHYYRC